MNISFRSLNKNVNDFQLLYRWCQQKFVYEWFEQKILLYDEIAYKYTNKLKEGNQELFIIQCDDKDIGFTQIYRYNGNNYVDQCNNTYEFDVFIGEEDYLSKGIGTLIVKHISNMVYSKYNADSIIVRPFKKNTRAIKCYEKCGYQIVGEYIGKDTLNNPEIILVLLNKKDQTFYKV